MFLGYELNSLFCSCPKNGQTFQPMTARQQIVLFIRSGTFLSVNSAVIPDSFLGRGSTSSWEIFSYLRLLDHIMSVLSSVEDLFKVTGQDSEGITI